MRFEFENISFGIFEICIKTSTPFFYNKRHKNDVFFYRFKSVSTISNQMRR